MPPLNHKMTRILNVKIETFNVIKKVPIEQRFKGKTQRKWTEEETNEFKKFVSEKLTLTDEKIAEVFGRSPRSVRHKRQNLGLLKKIEKGSLLKKNPNWKYTNEEISVISEVLSGCETRTSDVLVDLAER